MASSNPPSPPSSPSSALRKLRPWYLLVMMIVTWFLGINGLTSGCATVEYLRQGTVADVAEVKRRAADEPDALQRIMQVQAAARLHAMSTARDRTFPLGVAQMILAGLLLVASGMAMRGKKGSRSLALQAIAANVALGFFDYELTRPMRGEWIGMVVQAKDIMADQLPEHAMLMSPSWLWWSERARFVLVNVGIFGAAALALSTKRARTYFAAVAAATPADSSES